MSSNKILSMPKHSSKVAVLRLTTLSCALALAASAVAGTPPVLASNYDKRCYADIPKYRKPAKDFSVDYTPVSVTADQVEANLKNDINYSGNVEVIQGHRTLKADETTFNQETQELTAAGDIFYDDGEITVKSQDSLSTNLKTNETVLHNATYHINGSLVRGEAVQANLDSNNKTITLRHTSATTCPENGEAWTVNASTLNIDQNEVFGEAYNTTFWFYNVPVFYFPYINFPVKNERKSGILYPGLAYSKGDGLEFELPIYWNIAPNYDFTFSPRYLQHRGVLFKNEFRYLPFLGTQGNIYGEFINHDKRANADTDGQRYDTPDDDATRWFLNIKHHSNLGNTGIGLDIDYSRTKSRDYNYVNDYEPMEITDNQLSQMMKLSYNADHFESSVRTQYYQSLIPEGTVRLAPFRLLPEVALNYHNTVPNYFTYRVNTNLSNFYLTSSERQYGYRGQRYHFQPEVEVPIVNLEGLSLMATGRVFYTYYRQDIPEVSSSLVQNQGFTRTMMKEKVDRTLYSGELYGRMRLENLHENGFTSALVPEFKYIYIPYRNQDSIGLYDTTDRLYDYTSIFNYSQYAGTDRISDSNRLAYGLSYKFYDNNYRERFRMSIGQGYDFIKKRVKLRPNDQASTYPRTPIAGSINFSVFDGTSIHGDIIYNTREKETTSWNSQVNMNYDKWSGQFGYRYTRDGNRTLLHKIIDLKQLGGSFAFPLGEDVKAIAAMYYDLEQSRNIDQKVAIKYESCCYNIGFQVERYNKPNNVTMKSREETTYGIFFEFKGLTSVGIASDFSKSTHLLPVTNTVNLSE